MFSAAEKDAWRFTRYGLPVFMAVLVLLIQGCVAIQMRQPLPEHLLDQAQIADLTDIRYWGDAYSESLEKSAIESIRQEMAANHGKLEPEANFLAQRDEFDYNLAYIPLDFHPHRTSEFDTKYMNQEFEMAFNLARSGYKWSKYPPGFEPAKPSTPSGQ